ncbi:MAG: DUF2953 domain-containing protein [Bacillota bacterium]
MRYLALLLLLVPFLAVYFSVRIKAAIIYTRNEREEWLKFVFYTGKGHWRHEYRVPLAKKEGDKIRFKLVKGQGREMRGGTEENERLMPLDIIKKFNSVRMYLKDHGDLLEDIKNYLNKNNINAEFKIKLRQGTGDAALTGLTCGLLWAAAGILTAHISRHIKLFKNRASIVPCYDKSMFEVDASCIFHVRLVHIIVVLKKIYYAKFFIKSKMTGGEVSG